MWRRRRRSPVPPRGPSCWPTPRPPDAAACGAPSSRSRARASPCRSCFSPLPPALKWPNVVLLGGRKVAAILLEASSQGPAIAAAILGIGLNVSLRTDAYPEITATATSLAEQLAPAPAPERAALLVALLQALEDYYEALRRDRPIYDEWRERLETIGRQGRGHVGSTVEDGGAGGGAADGALLLRRPDGSLLRLLAGDVTLREWR